MSSTTCSPRSSISSAAKKRKRRLATNLAVAGCRTMMSMMSRPSNLPRSPRNSFSDSSWSSERYSNWKATRPYGQMEALVLLSVMYSAASTVQPVKALAHSLTSCSV